MALRAVPAVQPVRVVTDSKYVYDGATSHMTRWFTLGGSISNRTLWDELRQVLAAHTALTAWKHVYIDMGVVGNEYADALANTGRLSHPGRAQFIRDRLAR